MDSASDLFASLKGLTVNGGLGHFYNSRRRSYTAYISRSTCLAGRTTLSSSQISLALPR